MSSNDEVQDGMVRQTLADRKAKPSVETNMDLLGGQLQGDRGHLTESND